METHPSKKSRTADETFGPLEAISSRASIPSFDHYLESHRGSLEDNEAFWSKMATDTIDWFHPFSKVMEGGFKDGDIAWFLNGKLNATYQCIDRHLTSKRDKIAILWEGNDPDLVRRITYGELYQEVNRLSNALKSRGVRKGDTVAIYMPMVPEAAFAMLACARIGAIHSVVFAGFSAEALRDRILDAGCRVLLTADEGVRGAKVVPLKATADSALIGCPQVKHVLVFKRTGSPGIHMEPGRDEWMRDAMMSERPYCRAEVMDSEDPLFILYTSGSTGKPKGIVHTTAGYLLYASTTHRYVFDVHDDDIYACVADVGWITGHSYIVYGPLFNGVTTMMFEGIPTCPGPNRYWDMVERHRINIFYTAPTAIRALMRYGKEPVEQHDLSSLRILGTVGEPINPAAWHWYYQVVGRNQCAIVDTWWQTETGGILLTPLPGATPLKPGSATFPFLGIEPVLLDGVTGNEVEGNNVEGLLAIKRPWPSIGRTIWGDHQRYLRTYMSSYEGYYLTGDGAKRDQDGYYWITGRVDDVINVSGHRLGTAEIESAIVSHPACSESAVIAIPHDVKGQAIVAYCCLRDGYDASQDMRTQLKLQVRSTIGAFASPDLVVITAMLPKTRSGKIMRRVLRKIAEGMESLGDVSTLADSTAIDVLKEAVAQAKAKH